jgi:hypothetical protein
MDRGGTTWWTESRAAAWSGPGSNTIRVGRAERRSASEDGRRWYVGARRWRRRAEEGEEISGGGLGWRPERAAISAQVHGVTAGWPASVPWRILLGE